MRNCHRLLLLVASACLAASAQSVPFTITSLNLPVTATNSTYYTTLASQSFGSASVTATGFPSGTVTVNGTGILYRERGLNCGNTIQLSLTFAFGTQATVTVLAWGPGTSTSGTFAFTVMNGTGAALGVSGSGTLTATFTQTSAGAGTITGSGTGNLALGTQPVPVISPSGIVPVFSSVPIIQPGSWISIYGSNFATRTTVWSGNFPTTLDSVSVSIDNKPAYIWYVSQTQINVQVPDDATQGCVDVTVKTPNGSASSQVTLHPQQPSFSLWSGTQDVSGIIVRTDGSGAQGGGVYDFLGPASGLPGGIPARPARPGDVLQLYGVGFGPVKTPVPAGQPDNLQTANPTNLQVAVTIGGQPAQVTYAGLSQAGSYQLNVVVPQVPGGDQIIVATVPGANPLLFSSDKTQNCLDPDPQGPIPATCNVYVPVQ